MTDRGKFYTSNGKYEREQVLLPFSEEILTWDDEFHELMLHDRIRMAAYEAAIKEVVKPGMTIVDVGTGTGILALWALEAGARKAYGIDVNPARIPQARERITKAGYADRFEVYNALSYNVGLPERVDVIISELLGNLADNEDMTPILEDARKRFLKEGGCVIPTRVKTYIVPINSMKAHQQVGGMGSGFKNKHGNPFNLYYDCIIPESAYLSNPKVVREFNFDGSDEAEYQVKMVYPLTREGIFTGFKGSFVAQLSDKVTLDISGGDIKGKKTSDCWKHAYLPIENPIEVREGDTLELCYSRFYPAKRDHSFRQCYAWEGEVNRDGK